MNTAVLKNLGAIANDNSPAILAGVGVAGVAATAVLAARGGTNAERILSEHPEERTRKETFLLVWKEYAPAAVVGVGTATAIVMSTRIGLRRTAAMTAAFTISEKTFGEYRAKVVEQLGKNKATKIDDAVAQAQIDKAAPPGNLIVLEGTDQLCFDAWSGRYFKSNMETLKKAQNDLNYSIITHNYASLSDFYDLIGLEHTQESDDIGWSLDNRFEIEFSTCISPDQKPAISIRYRTEPVRGFHRFL